MTLSPFRYPGHRLFERRMRKFLLEPPTVGRAAGVIVTFTAFIVVISGIVMWLADRTDFPTLGLALWWATQTATTVGFGDVVPHQAVGRVIGVVVMLEGIAFLAVLTAAITSTFVTRAQRELGEDHYLKLLQVLDERLERIERKVDRDHPDRTMPPTHAGG